MLHFVVGTIYVWLQRVVEHSVTGANNCTGANAPINIMPHYPPPGLYRGKGGAFDLF